MIPNNAVCPVHRHLLTVGNVSADNGGACKHFVIVRLLADVVTASDQFASSAAFRRASSTNLSPFIDISMAAMLSVSRVQSTVLLSRTIRGLWTTD